ncbi:MAG: alpha-1,2-fucosyltransferase [Bacteroides sp.]
MVYTTLTDRIGNNLFQIAAGASLAHANHSDYLVCITNFILPDGNTLQESIAEYRKSILRNIKFLDGIPNESIEYVQPGFHYTPITYFDNIRLTGYYQTEKYFDKDYVRQLFSIDNETLAYIKGKYKDLFEKEVVSIHVRRGDYVKDPRRHPVCSKRYFRNAINYIGRDKTYLVISDDIEWCKTIFRGSNYVFSEKESAIVDLYLQTLCTHNIISNSSFSWWGAWLNTHPNKIVIAPNKRWFGKQLNHANVSDVIPQEWIRLNNPLPFSLRLKIFRQDAMDFPGRVIGKLKRLCNG